MSAICTLVREQNLCEILRRCAYRARISLTVQHHAQQLAQHSLSTSKTLLQISNLPFELLMFQFEKAALLLDPAEPLVVVVVRGSHTLVCDLRKDHSPARLEACLLAVDAVLSTSSGQVHESFVWLVCLKSGEGEGCSVNVAGAGHLGGASDKGVHLRVDVGVKVVAAGGNCVFSGSGMMLVLRWAVAVAVVVVLVVALWEEKEIIQSAMGRW